MPGELSKQDVLIGVCKNGSAQISGCVVNGNGVMAACCVLLVLVSVGAFFLNPPVNNKPSE